MIFRRMCCWAEFDWQDYNPYRGLLQGKEGGIFCLVFIYLLRLLAFFYDIHREALLCTAGHRSNQSPLTVRKSMFNFPSYLCPQPHRKKQLFYFPSFTTETLKTQHVQMFDRCLFICTLMLIFFLFYTEHEVLISQAIFFLWHH